MLAISRKSIAFLQLLKDNNERVWFKAHEEDYRAYVLAPLVSLVEEMGEAMLDIDADFEVTPAISKTISRIYRDTRFSKDKSPYRSSMWITFKRPGKEWQDEPGYYFDISPEHYSYGMGLYQATRETMDRFRGVLETNPGPFQRIIAPLADFAVGGESYKRTINPDIPAELQAWYQRKSFYLLRTFPIEKRLFAADFPAYLTGEFQRLAPLYYFLEGLKG